MSFAASSPLVSVLTTAFNREAYIGQAIESILASTLKDLELIIVDDCSTDNTLKIAITYEERDERVKVFVNEKNLGDYHNRNIAASYANGKYIKYLDSDDTIYPHGLQVMVDAMEAFPDAGFGLASKPEDERPYPVCLSPEQIYAEHFGGFGHFNRAPGSSVIRRDVFLAEGGFSGERLVGDLELWLRLARKYKMVKFPFDLYWNRLHQQQEVNASDARTVYRQRTNELLLAALRHPDCPLPVAETQKFINSLKRPTLMKIQNKISRRLS